MSLFGKLFRRAPQATAPHGSGDPRPAGHPDPLEPVRVSASTGLTKEVVKARMDRLEAESLQRGDARGVATARRVKAVWGV